MQTGAHWLNRQTKNKERKETTKKAIDEIIMLIKLVLCAQSLLKFVITLYLSIPFDEREAVEETPKNGYSLRKNIMCIVIY